MLRAEIALLRDGQARQDMIEHLAGEATLTSNFQDYVLKAFHAVGSLSQVSLIALLPIACWHAVCNSVTCCLLAASLLLGTLCNTSATSEAPSMPHGSASCPVLSSSQHCQLLLQSNSKAHIWPQ